MSDAQAVLLFYDVTKISSFKEIDKWYEESKVYIHHNFYMKIFI